MTTIERIAKEVRAFSGDLFAAAQKLDPQEAKHIISSGKVDPEMLAGLTAAELQRHEDPAGLLAAICRPVSYVLATRVPSAWP